MSSIGVLVKEIQNKYFKNDLTKYKLVEALSCYDIVNDPKFIEVGRNIDKLIPYSEVIEDGNVLAFVIDNEFARTMFTSFKDIYDIDGPKYDAKFYVLVNSTDSLWNELNTKYNDGDGFNSIDQCKKFFKDFELGKHPRSRYNFSQRLNKLFSLTRKSPIKISDIYEVKDGKIICNTSDEVREVVDKIVELNDWDVEVVCNFEDAYYSLEDKFYTDLSKLKLNTSKVTSMDFMFIACDLLKSIPQLDTSNVTSMNWMFSRCNSLTSIPQLDTSKVTSMKYMFSECTSLTSIPRLDTSKVTNVKHMFRGCDSLRRLGYPIDDNEKMLEIISTTGIDGKPYKGQMELWNDALNNKKLSNFSERLMRCFSNKKEYKVNYINENGKQKCDLIYANSLDEAKELAKNDIVYGFGKCKILDVTES